MLNEDIQGEDLSALNHSADICSKTFVNQKLKIVIFYQV